MMGHNVIEYHVNDGSLILSSKQLFSEMRKMKPFTQYTIIIENVHGETSKKMMEFLNVII